MNDNKEVFRKLGGKIFIFSLRILILKCFYNLLGIVLFLSWGM